MNQDLRNYFKKYIQNTQRPVATIGTQLVRSGIDDMDTLCRMLENEPEKVRSIRNIGSKRMEIISSICADYRSERGRVCQYGKEGFVEYTDPEKDSISNFNDYEGGIQSDHTKDKI